MTTDSALQDLYNNAHTEIDRHLEDAEVSKLGHWHAAAVLESRHRWLIAVPTVVLSALLTWLLMMPDGIFASASSIKLAKITPPFIALLVTLVAGLDLMLGLKNLVASHRNAALSYQEVWRHCKNWSTDYPDYHSAEKAAQSAREYRDRLNSINRNSPQLPKWAWRSVSEQRAEGSVSYRAAANSDKCS